MSIRKVILSEPNILLVRLQSCQQRLKQVKVGDNDYFVRFEGILTPILSCEGLLPHVEYLKPYLVEKLRQKERIDESVGDEFFLPLSYETVVSRALNATMKDLVEAEDNLREERAAAVAARRAAVHRATASRRKPRVKKEIVKRNPSRQIVSLFGGRITFEASRSFGKC